MSCTHGTASSSLTQKRSAVGVRSVKKQLQVGSSRSAVGYSYWSISRKKHSNAFHLTGGLAWGLGALLLTFWNMPNKAG
jgi:hypothetical protein